jgi:hypothetical protein
MNPTSKIQNQGLATSVETASVRGTGRDGAGVISGAAGCAIGVSLWNFLEETRGIVGDRRRASSAPSLAEQADERDRQRDDRERDPEPAGLQRRGEERGPIPIERALVRAGLASLQGLTISAAKIRTR